MTPADLLIHLATIKVKIIDGPALDDPGHHLDDDTLCEVRRHRWLFVWAVEGARTGHRWYACATCAELQLINKAKRCAVTYGCKGPMRQIGPVVTQPAAPHTPRSSDAASEQLDLAQGVTSKDKENLRHD